MRTGPGSLGRSLLLVRVRALAGLRLLFRDAGEVALLRDAGEVGVRLGRAGLRLSAPGCRAFVPGRKLLVPVLSSVESGASEPGTVLDIRPGIGELAHGFGPPENGLVSP
ncbi:hypothetical protein [Segniliparus rugosus]|uniref:hypothetical protein n=1 Tax=Segniliparus rugosus TaxID=286804 RepID=UPI00058C9BBB|nr:hypothetical protein [Segniliparus rugosus]